MPTPTSKSPSLDGVRSHAAAREDGILATLTDWALYQQRRIDEQYSLIVELTNKVARLETQLALVFPPARLASETPVIDEDPFASEF